MRPKHFRAAPHIATGLALGAALLLGGCTALAPAAGGSADSSTSGGGATTASGVAPDAAKPATEQKSQQPDRQIVTTGTLVITTKKPMDAAAKATSIVESAGGRVDFLQELEANEPAPAPQTPVPPGVPQPEQPIQPEQSAQAPEQAVGTDGGSATLTLRIPAAVLTTTLDKLRALGHVDSLQTSAVDITTDAEDLDARITAQTASVNRLITLMSNATDTNTLITLEDAVSTRQAALESLQSQRAAMADQVALSTITLTLQSTPPPMRKAPDNFFTATLVGVGAFGSFWVALSIGVGYLVPWIVAAGVITVIVLVIVRRSRRPKIGQVRP